MADTNMTALRDNTLKVEIRLATRLRQCFRALEAQDDLAVQDEIPLIIRCLYVFLDYLLESDNSWDPRGEKWFDDMIHVQHQLIPPGRFRISGELVWGMLADTGPQWAEPFYADVAITDGRHDTEAYCIRFGRRDDDAKQELKFGFYPGPPGPAESIADPWCGRADWKYEFAKDNAPDVGSAGSSKSGTGEVSDPLRGV
jgi:hypothetical protein